MKPRPPRSPVGQQPRSSALVRSDLSALAATWRGGSATASGVLDSDVERKARSFSVARLSSPCGPVRSLRCCLHRSSAVIRHAYRADCIANRWGRCIDAPHPCSCRPKQPHRCRAYCSTSGRRLPHDGAQPARRKLRIPTAGEHRRKGEPSRAQQREHGEPYRVASRGGHHQCRLRICASRSPRRLRQRKWSILQHASALIRPDYRATLGRSVLRRYP
jgi:hypothetical protein